MSTIDFSKVTNIGFNKDRIPSQYTEVQYVKSVLPGGRSTSTLYVDLKVSSINGCRVRGSIDINESDHSLYGARNNWSSTRFGFTLASESNHQFVFMHANDDYRFDSDTNVHFIDDNCSQPGYCLIDDRTPLKLNTSGSVSSNNLWLFNDNSSPGGDYGGACTIYSAEFYQNQVLVSYPIPCKRNSDNVVGFYDIVNSRFLTATVRKGTAYLEAGPVVNKVVIKITDKDGNVLWSKPSLNTNNDETSNLDYPDTELLD